MVKTFSYTSQQITVTTTGVYHQDGNYLGSYIEIGNYGSNVHNLSLSYTYTLPNKLKDTTSSSENITIGVTARYKKLYEVNGNSYSYNDANLVTTSFTIYQHNALGNFKFSTAASEVTAKKIEAHTGNLTAWDNDTIYLKVPFTTNAHNRGVYYYKNTDSSDSLSDTIINTTNNYYQVTFNNSELGSGNTAHVKFVSKDPVGSSTAKRCITLINPNISCINQVTNGGTVQLAMQNDSSSFKDDVKYSIQAGGTGSGTITDNIFTASSAGKVTIVAKSLLGGTRTREITILSSLNKIDMVEYANYGEIIELKWTGNGGTNPKLKYWGDVDVTLYEGQKENNTPINVDTEGNKKVYTWSAASDNSEEHILYVHISNTNKQGTQALATFNFEIECAGVKTEEKQVNVNGIGIEIS